MNMGRPLCTNLLKYLPSYISSDIDVSLVSAVLAVVFTTIVVADRGETVDSWYA